MKNIILLASITLLSFSVYAQNKKELTNEDIWQHGAFTPKTITGLLSMKDGKHYSSFYTDPKSGKKYILQYDYATGKVSDTILRESQLVQNSAPIEMDDYQFSPDETKIMISNSSEQIYRHSTRELNFVFDRKTKVLKKVSDFGKQMYASFSPDGSKVAFVRDNNIFIKNLVTDTEEKITQDGVKNHIINGSCDWVYEEEFTFDQAFFWSENGSHIAYYKFDENRVKEFTMMMFGDLYPKAETWKYPKAGEENSIVSIHIFDTQTKQTRAVDIGPEKDQYIPRIKWTKDDNTLCVLRMNRHQNKLEYLLADAKTGNSKVILTEESKTYIDINDDLTFLNDKKSFIISSEKDGYNHLYMYDMSGKQLRQITSGNWEVTKYYGIDPQQKTIFYQSTESSPTRRDIYSISIDGKTKLKLNAKQGMNKATFSADFSFFINEHADANTPVFITLNNKTGKQIRVLEDNKELIEKLKEYKLSKKEFFTITTSEGVTLNAWMIKPSDFNPNKKYPVYMFVYGGVGKQTVMDDWGNKLTGYEMLWHHMIAEKGYIVVSVDNRGTPGRGVEFRNSTYMNLGKLETIDQIESAKWLAKQPYVDASRIGIEGWSYGGYMSSLCITKGADVFKTAIAVAPVTNWKYYDSIYTERFLRTPKENEKGYEENSPINFVDKLKGNYLIVHGTGDDNVHFQNSVDMVTAMINANKKFESAYYPNKAHSISGGNSRVHLFSMMTDYILTNL